MTNKHLILIDVVGLTPRLIGPNTPNINRLIEQQFMSPMRGVFPAVTTTAQSTMLTGVYPDIHGVVGNGWYDRNLAEIMFWKQSNRIVKEKKIWDTIKKREKSFTCSKLFWWYNMYANVDASITPRPHYPADGRKIIDLYSTPPGLHQSIEEKIGKFPFFKFWGPQAGIESSQWIAKAAMLEYEYHQPNFQLIYLPHLDYCLQKYGPEHPDIENEVKAIDRIVGSLLNFYQERLIEIAIVSEYGITQVDTPVYINRILREKGYIRVRESLSWEMLDPGACEAFAVADHQVAHIYVNKTSKLSEIKKLLSSVPGIEFVLGAEEKHVHHIEHQRSGDLIAIAEKNAWFAYYYWLDDSKAPDFARTVDIHRKPGYDPLEMFVDPKIMFPRLKIIRRLLQKGLGFRMLMDVIPLDAKLVRGSHGRMCENLSDGPLAILPKSMAQENLAMTDLCKHLQEYFV